MRTLLQLNTSLYSNEGQSSQLTQRYVDAWSARNPNGAVIVRDLAADPVPHLTAERFAAFNTAPAARSGEQQLVVDYSDRLIEELRRADTVVIGLPMYNFGVPSTLKAYFDHVARANVTFKYTETGPVGLLTGKQVIVVATRGGAYAGTPLDSQTDYVRQFLGFIGLKDVEFVYAEGLAMGARRETSLALARDVVDRLHSEQRIAA